MAGYAQTILHYFLHLGFPLLIAYGFFRQNWKQAYLLFLATMLVDLDHLIASPVFQANRCSINFHPLHTYYVMIVYVFLLFRGKFYQIIGVGLLFHMFTDFIDCILTFSRCGECLKDSPIMGLLQWLL